MWTMNGRMNVDRLMRMSIEMGLLATLAQWFKPTHHSNLKYYLTFKFGIGTSKRDRKLKTFSFESVFCIFWTIVILSRSPQMRTGIFYLGLVLYLFNLSYKCVSFIRIWCMTTVLTMVTAQILIWNFIFCVCALFRVTWRTAFMYFIYIRRV